MENYMITLLQHFEGIATGRWYCSECVRVCEREVVHTLCINEASEGLTSAVPSGKLRC